MEMYLERLQGVPDRIVSIHQPHARQIAREKPKAKVEFDSKIHVSVKKGMSIWTHQLGCM
jgi:hypothetical protein